MKPIDFKNTNFIKYKDRGHTRIIICLVATAIIFTVMVIAGGIGSFSFFIQFLF